MTTVENKTPMDLALVEARAAALRGEVPVGAVLLDKDGQIVASAGNRVEELHDPSAHAELIVLRQASTSLRRKRLNDCTLVVSLEPCPMCAAAIVHFRVKTVVFGAYDPKGGGVDHGPRIFEQRHCLHRPEVIGGVRETESATILREFFSVLRMSESP